MRDRLVTAGYLAAWRLVRALPEGLAERLFRSVADRAYRRDGKGVRRLRANLRRVVGSGASDADLAVLTRDAMRSYARYWMEAFRLPSYSPTDIDDRFTLERAELFAEHRAAGTGVIVAIPHSGNWDLAGAWVASQGNPLTTVAERLEPEGVFERFLAFRRGLGMEILPHVGGDRPAQQVLSERIAAGHVVALVADRDLTRSGVQVDFFGARAKMPAGPALLAVRTGAPLYTVVLHYDGPRHCRGRLIGPVPIPTQGSIAERVAAVTQSVADAFAAGIAAHPADWHMLQRLWIDDLDHAAAG